MRNRGLISLAIATVAVLALAAVAVQVLPTGASTNRPGGGLDAAANPRRPAGSAGHLDELRLARRSKSSIPSDKPGLYAGDPDGTARGTGPASFPERYHRQKADESGGRWSSIRRTAVCRSCRGRRSDETTGWRISRTTG